MLKPLLVLKQTLDKTDEGKTSRTHNLTISLKWASHSISQAGIGINGNPPNSVQNISKLEEGECFQKST